jgi:hypothetical protein
LLELMVALALSTLVLGMILSIFLQISFAYRGQQQISGVQQVLAAARGVLEIDAKQTGLELAQGFKIASDGSGPGGLLHSPIVITNSATGADQIAFYYADLSAQAAVTTSSWPTNITVDSATGFSTGDLVVLTKADITTTQNPLAPASDAKIATFDACVLQISSIAGSVVTFATALPWGRPLNDHCSIPSSNSTMMFKFVARWYRIDTSRPVDGVLQVSPTGNLFGINDFQDLAYGFTDLQVATYFFDNDAVDTPDPDADPKRDWWSDGTQGTLTAPIAKTASFTPPLQVTLSLVARTGRDVEGAATAATPALTIAGNTANNMVGDRPSVTLPSATDPALQGSRIYRYVTFRADLRNMGVGR